MQSLQFIYKDKKIPPEFRMQAEAREVCLKILIIGFSRSYMPVQNV
jgi:hypothetical protein